VNRLNQNIGAETSSELPARKSPAIRNRIERHKAEKLERIKLAARKLFERKGFAHTSISEIAHAADVGVGTVFLYAASKEQLLILCFRDEVGSSIEQGFRTVPRAPLLEQVIHVFNVMIEHHQRNVELARIFVKEVPFASDDPQRGVREVMDRFYRQMEGLIRAAQRSGQIRADIDSACLANNLFALYIGFLLRWLGGERKSLEQMHPGLREILELQLVGLGTHRAQRPVPSRMTARGKTSTLKNRG
jgi:AcrR family transcriptional regulator